MTACLRIPDFPLWALLQLEPALRERPVLLKNHREEVVSVSSHLPPEILPGMPVARALALCQTHPDLVVRMDPAAHAELLWEEALERVNRETPRLVSLAPGLALAQLEKEEAATLARVLSARVGLAGDPQTARLAALVADPFLLVPVGHERAFAEEVSVLALAAGGVNEHALQRLIWFGFPTVGSLAELSQEQLNERFGATQGELLYLLSRPGPPTSLPLYRPAEEVEDELPCEPPLRDAGEVLIGAGLLLRGVLARLRPRLCSKFTLGVELEGEREIRLRRLLKQPSGRYSRLWTPLERELERLLQARSAEVVRLKLALGGLKAAPTQQGTLFRERARLQPTLQLLHSRFPGKLKRIDWHEGGDYLPEEAYTFRDAVL